MSSLLAAAPGDPIPSQRMPAGVAILLWACEPDGPHRLASPFQHAAAAAAMKLPVEIHFTARSVLLQPGVAENLRPSPYQPTTVLELLRSVVEQGAVLLACAESLQAHGMNARHLIPECSRRGGAMQFMGRVCDPDWRTLVF